MDPIRRLVSRHAASLVRTALGDTRVVTLIGARQTGKSTLARALVAEDPRASYLTLDDADVRAAARADPRTFVEDRPGLLAIDEFQRTPELLLAIKASVDRDPRPGRFLLTGSAHPFAVRPIVDLLPGRMELIELEPLSQGEIEGRRERFVDAVLDGDVDLSLRSPLGKLDYLTRACAGGFPEVLARDDGRRAAWFRSYLASVTQREVRDVANLSLIGELPRLVRLIAARHAAVLNVAALARDANIPTRSVHRYLDVLEAVFLIRRIPSWSRNLTAKEARAPKIVLSDSGLAAHLRGASAETLASPERGWGADGPILEGFALGELHRQIAWSAASPRLHHFRDRQGIEIDAVLEADDGRVAGIEVKAGSTVREEDLHALRLVRDRLGKQFRLGAVLHTGGDALSFGDRLVCLPLAALWEIGS